MTWTPGDLSEQSGLGAEGFDSAVVLSTAPLQSDFDELGHVNNIVYLRWVQDIAVTHWTSVAPEQMQRDFLFVVLRHEIDYRDPVLPGQEVEVRTWLGPAKGPRFDRHVDVRCTESKRFSARARTTWCMLSRETGRPQRVGQDVFDAFGIDPERLV